ncbi:hypothetical protein HY970_01220 [Candidatus Kaiserbacteria bacterium]|nr:hypothetical protein [Candidatus Kaiserbacteria bacterium]
MPNRSDGPLPRHVVERQAALMVAAIKAHKIALGIEPAKTPIDPELVAEAHRALTHAQNGSEHDPWKVLHDIDQHEPIQRFLKADGIEAKPS